MNKAHQKYYTLEVPAVITILETDADRGLSDQEVKVRQRRFGKNVLEEKKGKSLLLIFVQQLLNPIVLVLAGAAALAFAFGQVLEGIAVLIVILLNSLIGFLMEWQAMVSIRKLQSLSRTQAKVYRNGERIRIDSAELVPGDILYLEAGDMVTADARLIHERRLAIKEAALTGESTQVEKHTKVLPEDTILAERSNSVYNGTVVTRGNGKAVVTATGEATELGKISTLAEEAEKEETPLDKRLGALGKNLIWLTLILAALIIPLGIVQGRGWLVMIETAVALAVAAIPEGLPVIATISLARGMIRLAERNVIVKSLTSVQTLGETQVIFTDKTGTLTENKMYAETLVLDGKPLEVEKAKQKIQSEKLNWLLKVSILCNDSTFDATEDKKNTGDPIEVALLRLAADFQMEVKNIQAENPRIAEIPFDAELKMMGTLHESGRQFLVCVKGAAQEVLEKCTQIQLDGEVEPLKNRNKWLKLEDELAAQGLRILSFAYGLQTEKPDEKDFITDLTFLGLVGFIDPVRGDVKDAIGKCRKAGIEVIMITGDHPETAANIAKKAGLIDPNADTVAIHGKDLKPAAELSAEQTEQILKTKVFSRVSPEQKLDLITIFQDKNYIVGMTGDGVNDAPALKKANIGIAMGMRGTEAAKEVADMILKDDAFPSFVIAIEQGRIIFENIRKYVVYLLSCNLSEVLVVAIASFLALPAPLLPLQILFLNLVTDVFPALAIGMDKGEKNVMEKPPRNPDEPILTRALWTSIAVYGICLTVGVLSAEFYSLYVLKLPEAIVNNITFYTLILAQLWHVFNLPERSIAFFKNEVTRNPYIWFALLLCIGIVVIGFEIPPARQALALVSLKTNYLLEILLFSLMPVVLVQVLKRGLRVIV